MNNQTPKLHNSSYLYLAWNYFLSKKVILILFAIIVIFYLAGLWNRYVYIDDAWFGEQAYWFAKYGYAKTETIKDFFEWDSRLFVYHKLNIIIGAAIVKVFGWSVYYFKAFTLLIYIIFFFYFFKYFKFEKNTFNTQHYIIAAAFVFINPLMLSLSFTYRPEIFIMFAGFLSWFLLEKYFKNSETKAVIFSAIFASLAFLTHLNGMIFCFAGFILLLINKKWKGLIYFSLTAFFVSGLYFYDLWQPGHFEKFLFQMKSWPDNISTNYNNQGIGGMIYNMFMKLLDEHQRFFWSERVQASSIIFILSLIIGFKTILILHKRLLIYLLVLVVSLNILGSQIAERYLIYFFPYFAIIISIVLIDLINKKYFCVKFLFLLAFIAQIVFCGMMFKEIFEKNKNTINQHEALLSKIPDKHALTLVSYEYVFNALENRNLATYKGFEYYQKLNQPFTQTTFFQRAQKLNIQYIVLGKEIVFQDDEAFPFFAGGKIEENPYYKIFYKSNEAVILEKK